MSYLDKVMAGRKDIIGIMTETSYAFACVITLFLLDFLHCSG